MQVTGHQEYRLIQRSPEVDHFLALLNIAGPGIIAPALARFSICLRSAGTPFMRNRKIHRRNNKEELSITLSHFTLQPFLLLLTHDGYSRLIGVTYIMHVLVGTNVKQEQFSVTDTLFAIRPSPDGINRISFFLWCGGNF